MSARSRRWCRHHRRGSRSGVDLSTGTELGSLVNRYYDPSTAQFLSIDPLVAATGQPYQYPSDDPVNGSDPSGASIWGAIADSFNPFSQNNVFYRFGEHHPLAGAVVAGTTGVAAVGVGAAACVFGGCEYVGVAVGGSAVCQELFGSPEADSAGDAGASATAESIQESLSALEPGDNPRVSIVDSLNRLNELFSEYTQGGRSTVWKNYSGNVEELPDGTQVGIRSYSDTGGPTMDVRFPSGRQWTVGSALSLVDGGFVVRRHPSSGW